MIVEFIGGSMDGLQKKIERFFEYINADNEIYYARIIKYEKLGWIYVWYQFQGNLSEQMVN